MNRLIQLLLTTVLVLVFMVIVPGRHEWLQLAVDRARSTDQTLATNRSIGNMSELIRNSRTMPTERSAIHANTSRPLGSANGNSKGAGNLSKNQSATKKDVLGSKSTKSKAPLDSSVKENMTCNAAMQLPTFSLEDAPDRTCTSTMVILSWSRQSKVLALLEEALKYPSSITEIILWNNNPKQFPKDALPRSSIIRVIDSPDNIMDRAKYEACAMASNSLCLYADDDWNIFPFFGSLCHAYGLNPTLIHSTTDAYTFYTNAIEWVYDEPSLGLHTRFGWIGYGALIPQPWAQRHLKILDACVPKAHHILADVIFLTLTNQYMIQPQIKGRNVEPSEQHLRVQIEKEKSIGTPHPLQEPLQLKTGDYLVKVAKATNGEILPQSSSCVTRTLCIQPAICSLCTNFLPAMPRPGFDPENLVDRQLRTRQNRPTGKNETMKTFTKNPYSNAVARDKRKKQKWVTDSLPPNATWGIRGLGNVKVKLECDCEHDDWDVESGRGKLQKSLKLCPSSSFMGLGSILFHHRGSGGRFSVSVAFPMFPS